jgi:predicted ribosome quality control (RQC) complex YloA/Tae2 family protein
MEKQCRSLRAIESDLQKCSRADEYEEFGSLLISNLDSIAGGSPFVDLSNGSRTITIQLDGRLSPSQNAQRYFAKAKASRLAQHEAGARAKALRADIEAKQHLLDTLEATTELKELRHFLAKHGSTISRLGIGVDGEPREPLPFRVFMVDGGFQVWAGKNSSNNDLLTTKYAKPNDLWFHVRGTGGSHVILRRGTGKGEPDKKARMEAASIAAYYSTMRNAAAVPVAMTEKKYVRKPKGAPAGTVVIERETVLFVEPGLPPVRLNR